jgi:hypothetical protein
VPEHQEQKATIAGLVPAALGGGNEFIYLGKGQVFSGFYHFV